MSDYFSGYAVVGVLVIIGVVFVAAAFSANRLLRPTAATAEKLTTYECRLSVPLGDGVRRAGIRRDHAGGDGNLHRFPLGRDPLRVAQGCAAMGVMDTGEPVDLGMPTVTAEGDGSAAVVPAHGPHSASQLGLLSRVAPDPIRVVLNWGRRYSLWVFNFGLACCAIEFIAASMSRHDFMRLGVIPFAPGPRQADLMVVSGTVTDKIAPAIRRLYEQMPDPKYVISFGACSNSGGPYWDSYCVTKGVDQIVPVDVYVPGCPPRPEALLQGIVKLQEKIAGESLADRYGSGRVD